jgi:hypothetical protein
MNFVTLTADRSLDMAGSKATNDVCASTCVVGGNWPNSEGGDFK